MAYEQRDNSGTVFYNHEKKNERGPDFSGTAMIDGKLYFMDAWEKSTRDGKEFFSFSFKEKTQQTAPRQSAPAPRQAPKPAPKSNTGFDDMSDDIPF